MDKQEYFVRVRKSETFPMIEVMIFQDDQEPIDYLGAKARFNFGTTREIEFVLSGNIGLPNQPNSPEAAEFVRWYNLSRSALNHLIGLVKTVDDLRRPVEAMIEGDTVVVRFKEAK